MNKLSKATETHDEADCDTLNYILIERRIGCAKDNFCAFQKNRSFEWIKRRTRLDIDTYGTCEFLADLKVRSLVHESH
jgi:hypothetical protein